MHILVHEDEDRRLTRTPIDQIDELRMKNTDSLTCAWQSRRQTRQKEAGPKEGDTSLEITQNVINCMLQSDIDHMYVRGYIDRRYYAANPADCRSRTIS